MFPGSIRLEARFFLGPFLLCKRLLIRGPGHEVCLPAVPPQLLVEGVPVPSRKRLPHVAQILFEGPFYEESIIVMPDIIHDPTLPRVSAPVSSWANLVKLWLESHSPPRKPARNPSGGFRPLCFFCFLGASRSSSHLSVARVAHLSPSLEVYDYCCHACGHNEATRGARRTRGATPSLRERSGIRSETKIGLNGIQFILVGR